MEYNLIKFKSADIFTMTTLLSKLGVKQIAEVFGKNNVEKLMKTSEDSKKNKKNKESDIMFVGANIAFQIGEIVFRNLAYCKDEIYTLVSHASGKTIKEVEELDMVEFFELVIAIVQMPQFVDFIKVASKLLK